MDGEGQKNVSQGGNFGRRQGREVLVVGQGSKKVELDLPCHGGISMYSDYLAIVKSLGTKYSLRKYEKVFELF